jgi:hypothetical protein
MKKAGKGGDSGGDTGGKFNIKAHITWLLGAAVGMLAISCPGGISRTAAGKMLGLSNTIGDKLLSSGTGGHTTAATRHAVEVMDDYGALVVLLLIAGVLILRKALPQQQKSKLGWGVWAGCTLGLSAGAAGLTGTVLVPLAEQLGHALGGAV